MSAADEAYDRLHGVDGHTQAAPPATEGATTLDAEVAGSIMESARRVRQQIETGACMCADEPHLNLLHDLAVDLAVHGDCRGGRQGELADAVTPRYTPDRADVDALRKLLDLMENFPDNDQRARYLLTCNWMRDRDAIGRARTESAEAELDELRGKHAEAEWLLRMTYDARDRAERKVEAVEALAEKLGATPDWNMSHRNVAQSIRTALAGGVG